MSNVVLYYEYMKKLVKACGRLQTYTHLYDDLCYGCPPSPDSYKVLVKHHESSLDVLRDKVNRAKKERAEIGRMIGTLAKACGIYPENENLWINKDAEVFCAMLMLRREDSDFREKVRDWSRSEIKKITKTGKEPDVPMSFKDYIDKYEALLKTRRKRKGFKDDDDAPY